MPIIVPLSSSGLGRHPFKVEIAGSNPAGGTNFPVVLIPRRTDVDVNPQINVHYGNEDIYGRILAALKEAGIDPASATVQDLAPIDQFHNGGFPASKALAERIEITPQTRVFDAGCGIGGASRFLAATYDCNV